MINNNIKQSQKTTNIEIEVLTVWLNKCISGAVDQFPEHSERPFLAVDFVGARIGLACHPFGVDNVSFVH